MIGPNPGLLPDLAIGALTSNSAMAKRNEGSRPALSTLLDLVSAGLVAAATILIFSIASFSFLYTNEGLPRGSEIRDRGVEVKPEPSGVIPYSHANRPPGPAETELPGPAAEATLSTSPPESRLADDMQPPEIMGAQPASKPPPGASEGSTTQDAALSRAMPTQPPEIMGAQPVSEPPPGASEASATQDASLSGTVPTQSPEVSGAQPASEPPPGANEGSATQDASLSGTVPTLPSPVEQRDRVFREFELHQHPKVSFDEENTALHKKIPTRHRLYGQAHDYFFSTNADVWRYRLRKECGPIKDPPLHIDCVRSFRTQYPVRYASPTRSH
jgi:hypothetical protein